MNSRDEVKPKGSQLVQRMLTDIGEKKLITTLTLMKNGKMSDTELMDVLNLNTSNSAAYYRKELEKEGIIKGYRAEIDWKKIGYNVRFIIIVEGETPELLLEMEEKQTLSIKEYDESVGDIYITPTQCGGIILEDVSFCFGNRAVAIIKGYATSEHDVVMYSKKNLSDIHPKIKTGITIIKDNIIKNFIIDKKVVDTLTPRDTPKKQDMKPIIRKIKNGRGTDYERLVRNLKDFFG